MHACGRTKYSQKGFKMLSKEAQNSLQVYEYVVICLMILIAIISMVWSLSLHVLFDDFYNGFVDISLAFSERDFSQLKEHERAVLHHDLKKINRTYQKHLPELIYDNIKTEALVMPKPTVTINNPKFQIKQLQSNSDIKLMMDDYPKYDNITASQLQLINDYYFLTHMTINIQRTRWKQSLAAYFIHNFPYLSEIIAIIWTVLSFVFQSGVKKQWGLPKPWLIVIPSILMFSLMVIANLSYLILANGYLNKVCRDLKSKLNEPEILSCGDAISLLKPIIRPHDFCHDTYLLLYHWSYILTLLLWTVALLIMVLRFLLAIDFRLVDLTLPRDIERDVTKQEFVEVLVNASTTTKPFKEQTKSEDDFQSAKSQVSEAATPLLDALVNTTPLKT